MVTRFFKRLLKALKNTLMPAFDLEGALQAVGIAEYVESVHVSESMSVRRQKRGKGPRRILGPFAEEYARAAALIRAY